MLYKWVISSPCYFTGSFPACNDQCSGNSLSLGDFVSVYPLRFQCYIVCFNGFRTKQKHHHFYHVQHFSKSALYFTFDSVVI